MPAPETAAAAGGCVAPLTLHLFGPFEVYLHGQPLPRLRSRKGQWLLALLVLRHSREVERAWLAGTLWPDSAEEAANASLRNSLKDLRRALGPEAGRLRSPTTRSLSLDLEGAHADVVAFDTAIAQGEAAALERAIALYRGPLLEQCAEEWALLERQTREQACLTALETLAAAALTRGDPAAAEPYLRRAVTLDPLRETAQRALMQALAAGGNYAAAIQVYRELRLRLHREINAAPDPETQALYQQLRAQAQGTADGATGRGGDGEKSPSHRHHPPLSELAHPVIPSRPVAPSLLTGTLTFLFTDIEGSSQLWEQYPEAMKAALEHHDALVRQAIQSHGGLVFKTVGDAFHAAFATAPAALAAALAAQQALLTEAREETGPLRVRMALHTGVAEAREGDYFGPTLNRAARLLEAGHGGQVLLSLPTEQLVRDALPEGASLRPLGEHRLKDLVRAEQVFQLLHPDLRADFPPLQSLAAFSHNLPLQWTSFIGREQEMAAVRRHLATARLVTLTGAGGCGKTRLVLQVAADLVEEFAGGVWLVELAALADPALVPQAVAVALGVREQPHRPLLETLLEYLRSQCVLLVLDNCEHLLSACAQLVEELLRRCAHLRVLATSREALGLGGEQTYRVPSLAAPDPRQLPTLEWLRQYEAVQLFTDRAILSQPTFAVTAANAAAVAAVCQRLEGIPLALELAAARVKALPVETINTRLDDMFRLLTGGSRTALPRQQTLRALIDWSYDLLSEAERALLRRLSVFAGGWTLEATEAVCSGDGIEEWEVLDLLTFLVEKSLVLYDEQGGEGRYRLLETVRQYARDRLLEGGEAEALAGRHADYFLQMAERAEPEFHRPEQVLWWDRLEWEHDNLRAALAWFGSAEHRAEAQLRLAGALWNFWFRRGYYREGRQWAEGARTRGRQATAPVRAKALGAAGALAHFMGDYAAADALLEESVALARAAGPKWVAAISLFSWALLAISQEEYARARARAQESLAFAQEAGDPWLRAVPLMILGLVALHQGDSVSARSFLEESMAVSQSVKDMFLLARTTAHLGAVALSQGECEQARALYREALLRSQEVADRRAIAGCLSGLAAVAAPAQPDRAARLFGAAEALREAMGSHLMPIDYGGYDHHVGATRAQLDEETFVAAWAEGRMMPLEQAIAAALEEEAPD